MRASPIANVCVTMRCPGIEGASLLLRWRLNSSVRESSRGKQSRSNLFHGNGDGQRPHRVLAEYLDRLHRSYLLISI